MTITATAKPTRRWLQFRLKTLFVLVVIAAIPCGLLKWKMVRKERERAAVVEINKLGGTVYYDWLIAGKKEPPGAAWLRKLLGDGYFSSVVSVNFRNAELTDDSLLNLEPLADLEQVHFSGRLISDAGLVHLNGMTRLKDLNLGGAAVTDAGLFHLRRLTALEDLNLADTNVTDAGLAYFRKNTKMRQLSLANTGVTDAGVAVVTAMTRLEQLYLCGTDLTDAGLLKLKGLTGLKLLNIAKTNVTAACVDELESRPAQLHDHPMTTSAANLAVDVISDVICPWCYVGKRRLEKAIAGLDVRVRWLPFQLNPQMPKEGISRNEYRTAKFGSWERSLELDAKMVAVGEAEGIRFAFDRIERTPNTVDAHRLIWLADKQGIQDAVVEGLFRAYFTEGRDISNRQTLLDVVAEVGLVGGEAMLNSDDGLDEIKAAQRFGVDGVPFFIINGKVTLAGAHPTEVFVAAFNQAK